MKVLLVHEYYRSTNPSGEDRAFEAEKKLLKRYGVTVQAFTFKNDLIGTEFGPSVFKTALFTPWSPIGKKWIEKTILRFRPDVVHFHNTFPLLSQSVVIKAKMMGSATVQTLHNFRTVCPQATLMRDDKICIECIDKKNTFPSLLHRCYRNSLLATLPLSASIFLHRYLKTWQTKADRIIVLSQFNKGIFERAGFPPHKICVKPNFFEDFYHDHQIIEKRKGQWIFIGRLNSEKGIQFLPSVWSKIGKSAPILHILGDGPLRKSIEIEVRTLGLQEKFKFHGLCSPDNVHKMLSSSSLLVFPSICYEGFPLVIGEAFAAGTAVAASKLGTTEHIIENNVTGFHMEPCNIEQMARVLSDLAANPNLLINVGMNSRKEFKAKYTAESNFHILEEIYDQAIRENNRLKHRLHQDL